MAPRAPQPMPEAQRRAAAVTLVQQRVRPLRQHAGSATVARLQRLGIQAFSVAHPGWPRTE
eukprot:221769-Pyramimonas_sp.AAC.1